MYSSTCRINHEACQSHRPPTRLPGPPMHLSIGSRNPKIEFYRRLTGATKAIDYTAEFERATNSNSEYLNCASYLGALITRLIPALMTTAKTIDKQPRKVYPSSQHISFFCSLCFYRDLFMYVKSFCYVLLVAASFSFDMQSYFYCIITPNFIYICTYSVALIFVIINIYIL